MFSPNSRDSCLSSTHDESRSFDPEPKNTLIYPKNLLIKKEQLKIVKNVLEHNTLACVRNDAEKTFLASMVIYNHFHWDSKDRIVFLSSTKLLLSQQMDACNKIVKILWGDMMEITSRVKPEKRMIGWHESRIIFTTPAIFLKALENLMVPTKLVKCVVVDEAHKAVGKHTICKSIKKLYDANPDFRLLGLTSKAEAKPDKFPEVMKNLFITHLELRDDGEIADKKRKIAEVEDKENDQLKQNKKSQDDPPPLLRSDKIANSAKRLSLLRKRKIMGDQDGEPSQKRVKNRAGKNDEVTKGKEIEEMTNGGEKEE